VAVVPQILESVALPYQIEYLWLAEAAVQPVQQALHTSELVVLVEL